MNATPAASVSQNVGSITPSASPIADREEVDDQRRHEDARQHHPGAESRREGQRDKLRLVAHLGQRDQKEETARRPA